MKINLFTSLFVALVLLVSSQVVAEDAVDSAPLPYQVNINTADIDELSSMLSGVGESKAQAIISYREEHGRFSSIEELVHVSGIGELTLESNRNMLTTGIE